LITSPCSVSRNTPLMVPAGAVRTSESMRPPPRAMLPPRAWNTTCCSLAAVSAVDNSACARCAA
jgi:hypothetical protein